jgi:hypothetical protein
VPEGSVSRWCCIQNQAAAGGMQRTCLHTLFVAAVVCCLCRKGTCDMLCFKMHQCALVRDAQCN